MPEYHMGPGEAWETRTDVSGLSGRMLGVLQEVTINIDFTDKDLRGQFQFPVVIARGQGKVTWTAKYGRFDGYAFADFMGLTPVVGGLNVAQQEPFPSTYTIPAATPFTVTVANAAQFVNDLGVIFAATGNFGLYETVAPTASYQYEVNTGTGVYTFFSADASKTVQISYQYNNTTTGLKLTMQNQLLGFTPTFRLVANQMISPGAAGGNTAEPFNIQLNAAYVNKLAFPTRLDDFEIIDLSGDAAADSAGNVLVMTTTGP